MCHRLVKSIFCGCVYVCSMCVWCGCVSVSVGVGGV